VSTRQTSRPSWALLDSLPAVVWEADPGDLRFCFVSAHAERLLGYPRRRWLAEGSFWENHLHPDDRQWALARRRAAVAKGEPHTCEYRMLAQAGQAVWVQDHVTVIRRGTKARVLRGLLLGMEADQQARAALLESQRREMLGRVVAGVAHDFNNLLMAVNGYADVLLSSLAETDREHQYAGQIKQIGRRGADLVKRLLAFGRQQALEPRVLDLSDLVLESASFLRRLIGENIDLQTRVEPNLGRVRADPAQIEQVLMNLVVNARDAMPRGGRLLIETANVPPPPGAGQGARSEEGRVALRVVDTGTGVDAAVLPRLFQPFYTTKQPGQGTGLGLFVVQEIVTAGGGVVNVQTAVGQGTTFEILLPMVAEDVPRSEAGAAPAAGSCSGNETLLVIEDEPAVRELLALRLRKWGYSVLEAQSGEEALAVCDSYAGSIHAVVTDVALLRMSGWETVERLALRRPGVKAVYISGYGDRVPGGPAEGDPSQAALAKPFALEDLARVLRRLLNAAAPGVPGGPPAS
jgi:PAS domain S-box-containing protein